MPKDVRRQSSRKKKLESLKRDRRNVGEYPRSFRKKWQLKRSRSHRAVRRQVRRTLSALAPEQPEIEVLPKRPKTVKKWAGTMVSLREAIELRKANRALREAANRGKKKR